MPRYETYLEVPAGTNEFNAVETQVRVEEQFIVEADCFIDESSNGEVFVGLYLGQRRLFPHPNGEAIRRPGLTDKSPIEESIPGVPNTLTWRAWSPEADFAHDVIGGFETKEQEQSQPLAKLYRLLSGQSDTGTQQPPPEEQL